MLGIGAQEAPAPAQGVGDVSLLPLTTQALQDAIGRQSDALKTQLRTVLPSPAAEPDVATKLGARKGVPLDTEGGLNFAVRTALELRRDPKEQEIFLKKLYGDENVRRNHYDDLVVTQYNAGEPKDVLVDPLGIDIGDMSKVAAQFPEIVGGLVPFLRKGGAKFAPGIWTSIKTLLKTTVGSEGAGLIKDVAVSAEKPLGEIGWDRTKMAAADVLVGSSIGAFTKVGTKLTSPFSRYGQLQFDARRAQDYFKKEFGVELPMTPAESTGSPFLQRTEAFALQKPGASAPIRAIIDDRNQKLKDIQTIALGGVVPDEETAGQRAIDVIGAKAAPARFAERAAKTDLVQTGERELQDTIASATGVSAPVDKTKLGGFMRESAFEKREEFKKASSDLYDEVFANPLTQEKNIESGALAKDARTLLDKLPTKEKIVESIDYDAYGNPISREAVKGETLREFVPEGVLSKLQSLTSVSGTKFRLDELMQMRREVANDIAAGEAVPGVQTKYLRQIESALTTRIKTGLDELKDPDLKAAWEKANTFYAENVGKFKKSGIAEMFRDAEQVNFVGDTEIVSRAVGGAKAQDIYNSYKQFYGPNSSEMLGFRRAVADDVLRKNPLAETLDVAGFVSRLDDLAEKAPALLEETFGIQAKQARNIAQALRGAEGNLPERELIAAVNNKTLTAEKLSQLLSSQSAKDNLYRNSIIKSVEDGTLTAERIKPTEFVDKFAFKAEPREVSEVMAMLHDQPEVTDDIRRLAYQKILDRATIKGKAGEEILQGSRIEGQLKDATDAKRLRTVLGNDAFNVLQQTANLLKTGEIRDQSFATAGGMSAGTQIAGLIERGEFKYVSQALKNFAIAAIYTSPTLRNYFANTLVGPQGSAMAVNFAIASTPFVKAVANTYGEEKGREVMHALKSSVDRFVQENPKAAQPAVGGVPKGQMTPEEFDKALGVNP